MNAESVARYLRLLEVPHRKPSAAALHQLVDAHLQRVPFENVSKLYRLRRTGLRGIPELGQYLDDIERLRFGGTCYSNNYYLHQLLESLGYQATLCGADMTRPDVHVVNLVGIEGREYLVDAGYGGPFLAPLPRDLPADHEIALGRDRYVLKPRDERGRSRLELHRDGRQRHGYVVKPEPRRIEDFAPAIAASFSESATFMNAVVLVRFFPGRSVVLQNLSLIESEGLSFREQRLGSVERLPAVIEERFGIPAAIAQVALAGLEVSREPWG
jgi:N-hydroxyarylamine O-acetyltransferase